MLISCCCQREIELQLQKHVQRLPIHKDNRFTCRKSNRKIGHLSRSAIVNQYNPWFLRENSLGWNGHQEGLWQKGHFAKKSVSWQVMHFVNIFGFDHLLYFIYQGLKRFFMEIVWILFVLDLIFILNRKLRYQNHYFRYLTLWTSLHQLKMRYEDKNTQNIKKITWLIHSLKTIIPLSISSGIS